MITTILFDLGGVLLSKGWDREFRTEAALKFALDEKFETRHQAVSHMFESGQLSLADYLARVVFNQPRTFTREQFVAFIHQKQTAIAASVSLLDRLWQTKRCTLATLNNESRELNEYRIATFGLRQYFSAFFSSCYLGLMKPNPAIYEVAVGVLQKQPNECLFVDDTAENLESARMLGMDTIHFTSAERLERELVQRGLI